MRSADSRADAPTGEQADEALERRLAAHAPALRAAASGLCRRGSGTELDDLIQDTFERALRHLSAGRPAPINERAWLVSILRNAFVDRLRAMRPTQDVIDELPAPSPNAEPAWARISLDDVRGALDRIDPGLRAAFELHYFRNQRYADIAAALGIPINSVASRLHRARKAVRDSLLATSHPEDP